MAEDEELEGLDAFEEAEGEEAEDELDPLAQEMLKAMEEGEEGDSASQGDVDQMMEMEMLKAMEEEGGVGGLEGGAGGRKSQPAVSEAGRSPNIARLLDVDMMVTIELGRTDKTLEEVLSLGEQSLVELDKQVGEPVDILVNGKLFARGEVVTVSENFGVRITEILGNIRDL